MRGQKGITLVALIITIVVLLILAVVSITTISNDGILNYANNAANIWQQGVKNEQDAINNLTDKTNQYFNAYLNKNS